jgi:RimJ/RimL family protein N-acetyltransferase
MSIHSNLGDLLEFHLETERLLLVPITMDYAEEIFDEFTDEITQFMYPQTPRRIQETESFIRESLIELERETSLQLVILEKETKEFFGCAGLHNLDSRFPELGIWLKLSAHRQGLGMETIVALKKWADEHVDYDYLQYPVDVRNYPSRRIPEALGATPERTYWTRSLNGIELEILEYRIYPLGD